MLCVDLIRSLHSPPHGYTQLGTVTAGVDPGLGEGEDGPRAGLDNSRDPEASDGVGAGLGLL